MAPDNRELRAVQRTLGRDADGNWRERWLDGRRPDHFAHAEVYCLYAEELVPGPVVDIAALNEPLRQAAPWPGPGHRDWGPRDDYGAALPR